MKKTRRLMAAIAIILAVNVSGWRYGGVTNINAAQTALINWSAGGEGTDYLAYLLIIKVVRRHGTIHLILAMAL
ncbi:MAG: hypothetical protein JXR27_13010 [Paludibacteraceae bacterium]|nr:hypothetical protein [Paludibacteraceae bacterium]